MEIKVLVDTDAVAREGAKVIAAESRTDVHVVQVDERIAPGGGPDRNLTHLRESLVEHAPLPPKRIYAMPVEEADPEAGAKKYARKLQEIAGSPPILDLAHLGLGP